MKRYRVKYEIRASHTTVVEAEDEDEASSAACVHAYRQHGNVGGVYDVLWVREEAAPADEQVEVET